MSTTTATEAPWDTGAHIRAHTLSAAIINLHGTPGGVFDDSQLQLLQNFTRSRRSVETRDEVMREYTKDGRAGSLAGLLIERYGTDQEAFDERDWELLEGWFARGMPVGEHVQR